MENTNIVSVPTDNKNFHITFIQVISAIAVIHLHTNRIFHTFSSTEDYWFSANIIESICYFGVPIFFMLTGVTLLDYLDRYGTSEFFRRRCNKVLIPYLFWTGVGLIFSLMTDRISFETINIKWLINAFLSCNTIINIYWFFQPLFCIYLSMPLFASVDKKKKMKIANYLLFMGGFCNILIPFLNSTFKLGISWPYQITIVFQNLFWVWAGYFFYNVKLSKEIKMIIYFFSLLGLMTITIGTYVLSIKSGTINSLLKGNNNLPCVLYSIGVFVFLKDISISIEKHKIATKVISALGKYTFAAYLLHWFALMIIDDVFKVNLRSLPYRLLSPLLFEKYRSYEKCYHNNWGVGI